MPITPVITASPTGRKIIAGLLRRFQSSDPSCRTSVEEILRRVQAEKDAAVIEFCRRFDAPEMSAERLQVSTAELQAAYTKVHADFRLSLEIAIERIQGFHEREMEDSWLQTREDGTIVGRLVRPVDSAGLYVPGGRGGSTPLVSSVLMNGIPAGIAGVSQRVMVTPPDNRGEIDPHLLVAAQEIGVTEIYKVGSAWAIAALAFGTETIPRVDVIVGPGNQFVAEAKRQVSGMVRIDMIAGPSEVLIIADHRARAANIAADMLAQAEHDPQALAILVTTDENLAGQVPDELERQLALLSRRDIARRSLTDRGVILIAGDIDEAIGLANDIAIEHLELMIADPWAKIPFLRHAGAIFLGDHTPEAAGDYLAGPNHVLPTMGTARYASALGVETFLKKSSIISYSRTALEKDAEHIIRLARLEGLTAHAASVAVRLQDGEDAGGAVQGTFEDGLVEGLAALGLELDRQVVSSLALYQRELAHWSGRMNLVAKNTSLQQMVENHFLDSLTLLPLLPKGAHLLDVGSGAGFPGLACRVARPDIHLTMVEPRLKRVSFLRHIVRTLGLPGVEIVAGRIEDEGLLPSSSSFSHITSRAVSDIAGFLAMIERFSRPGLKVICMKGPKWREELAIAAAVIEGLPFALEEVVERRLPGSGAVRALLVFTSSDGI